MKYLTKKNVIIFLIILLALCVGVSILNIKEARRLNRVMKLVEITTGTTYTDENGQVVMDNREIKFNNNTVKLKKEFANPKEAMENIKLRYKLDLEKARKGSFLLWGELKNWNWKLYYRVIKENEEYWSKGDNEILNFFDIYENTKDNEDTIRDIVNK